MKKLLDCLQKAVLLGDGITALISDQPQVARGKSASQRNGDQVKASDTVGPASTWEHSAQHCANQVVYDAIAPHIREEGGASWEEVFQSSSFQACCNVLSTTMEDLVSTASLRGQSRAA